MTSAGTVLVLAHFCVILFVQDARACSCAPLDEHFSYCKADFAVKAEVVSQTWSSPLAFRVYNIITGGRELRTLKGNFTGVDLETVYTPFNGALCGVTLEQGKIYLLTGRVDTSKSPHRLRINLCGWTQTWNTLSLADKNFVTKGYLTRCP
uniref:TIMP-2 n=1 Tax=Sinohyriopsis cumingii TaxID=165450 RepID=A0A1Y0JYQ7_SINCU|nr:TIMP-2 [Sinohyriopsis cumingii]